MQGFPQNDQSGEGYDEEWPTGDEGCMLGVWHRDVQDPFVKVRIGRSYRYAEPFAQQRVLFFLFD